MNLVELIVVERKPERGRHSYNGYEFTSLQNLLYELFAEAIRERRRLVIPSQVLPRQSGKSIVLQKLSADFGLHVQKGLSILKYEEYGGEMRARGFSFRGIRLDNVLIDEPTSYPQLERSGALDFPCVGVGNFTIDQPFKSTMDIIEIETEINHLQREGRIYEHYRDYQNPRSEGLYSREFDTAWRWEGI